MKDSLGKNKKVALGLSGGVDSSVAAVLLLEQGYEVTGVYMQCWDIKSDGCAADEDKAYALQSAAKLGIKFIHLDFRERYKNEVINNFYSEYERGNTPNPDVLCNKEIKFGLFYDWAMKEGYDYVSTGHYARVGTSDEGNPILLKGADPGKDQSYFLYLLTEEKLRKILLPVGNLHKREVREIAKSAGLPTANRPDSMGICFIGEVNIKDFLKERLPVKKGQILDKSGNVVGSHDGAWFYTIGQRHGFEVKKYTGAPSYVLSKDVTNNILVVGTEEDVVTREFLIASPHWINTETAKKYLKEGPIQVRIRHLGSFHKCVVEVNPNGSYIVRAETDIFAVAPGQSAVFYQGDMVLGGAIITNVTY